MITDIEFFCHAGENQHTRCIATWHIQHIKCLHETIPTVCKKNHTIRGRRRGMCMVAEGSKSAAAAVVVKQIGVSGTQRGDPVPCPSPQCVCVCMCACMCKVTCSPSLSLLSCPVQSHPSLSKMSSLDQKKKSYAACKAAVFHCSCRMLPAKSTCHVKQSCMLSNQPWVGCECERHM